MYNKIKIALYALLSTVNVNLIGSMRLSEILLIGLAPTAIRKDDFSKYPYLKKIILSLALLLFSRYSRIW